MLLCYFFVLNTKRVLYVICNMTHLHTKKVITILIPSFNGLASLGTRGLQSREDRRKNKTPAFLESRSAKASSTYHIYHCSLQNDLHTPQSEF